jgi:hypothetical protein
MLRKALFRLWCTYFNPGAWEANGRVYERLGVRHVSKVLLGGYYTNAVVRRLRGRKHRTIRGKRSAYEWLIFTVVAELGHGIFFLVMLVMLVRYAWAGRWDDVVTTAVLNLIVNVVPIMVQRYNRGRVLRALDLDAAKVLDKRFWAFALDLDAPPPDAP